MTLHQAGDTAVDLPRVARRPLALLSGGLAAFLLILSTRYGPHRDELYFRTAGQQLAWGYVDQPASTPLVAGLVSELFGDALAGWRLPSALAAGAIVLLTGLLARRFGGDRPAQLLAAAAMAVAAVLLIVGHLLSTATFDLLFWTLSSFLVVRQLQGADPRGWLLVGLVAGIALHNKTLLAVGPRVVLRSGWLWAGAGLAALVWLPSWSGKPSTAGRSSRWPRRSPEVARVPGAARRRRAARGRLAAPTVRRPGLGRRRSGPVVPGQRRPDAPGVAGPGAGRHADRRHQLRRRRDGGLADLRRDRGGRVRRSASGGPGQGSGRHPELRGSRGDRPLRPESGPAEGDSGHNAYFDWGPPPDTGGPVVLVGFDETFLRTTFGEVSRAATLDNGLGVDNEEQGRPVSVGRDLHGSWAEVWPTFRRLG